MQHSFSKFLFILIVVILGCSDPSRWLSGAIGSNTGGISGQLTFEPILVKQIYLYEKIGNRLHKLDSASIGVDGNFNFSERQYSRGYYQLALSDTSKVNIILDPKETGVRFEFSDPRLHYGVKVIASAENKVLWDYKEISKSVQQELYEIHNLLKEQDLGSVSSVLLMQKKDSLIRYKKQSLDELCIANPNSFFTKVVFASKVPELTNAAKLKTRYFDNLDFSDPELIRSSVFPGIIMGYLKNHTELTEPGFGESIDQILKLANANSEVYAFCLEYLLEVFDRVGPPIVFKYIVEEHMMVDGCSEVDLTNLMKGKADAYVRLMPGKTVPDFTIPSIQGESTQLKRVVELSKTSLLFFWSSHCEFCEKAVPQMDRLLEQYSNLDIQVIAVSLDDNGEEWKSAINRHDLNPIAIGWVHLSDLKGWDSPAIKLYKVDRTPTFYLLDRQMNILAKPRSMEELARSLKSLK